MGKHQTKLTERQELFIQAYLANGFQATQAAIAAGYSPKSAPSQGHILKSIPIIKMKIDEEKMRMARVFRVDHETLVQKLVEIMNEGMEEGGSRKNALRAIEILAKHVGFFEADNRQRTTEINLPVINWVKTKK